MLALETKGFLNPVEKNTLQHVGFKWFLTRPLKNLHELKRS